MTSRRSIAAVLTAAILAAGAAIVVAQPAAPGVPNMLVIDAQLQPRAAAVTAVDSRAITLTDPAGERTTIPASAVAALITGLAGADPLQGVGALPAHVAVPVERLKPRMDSHLAGALRTTDGQRFPGDLAPTAGPKDSVLWQHPRLGQITFPLDKVAALVRAGYADSVPAVDADAAPVEDELILVNGDRLSGLVVDLGEPVRFETDGKIVELPAERVAAAILSNPRTRAGGTMIWLDDGTVAQTKRLDSRAPERLTVTLVGDQSAEYELAAVRGIAFDFGRLLPLSSLTPRSQTPVGDRLRARPIVRAHHPADLGVGPAVTLGAWDLELPGPMRVEYELPAGVTRLAATVALAANAAPWGDCELVITQGGAEVWRQRLSAESPSHALNVPAAPGTLTITLEPGAFGPVNDRVVLHRPLLLVK